MTTLTAERYEILRGMDIPPYQVRERIRELWGRPSSALEELFSAAIGMAVFAYVSKLVDKLTLFGELWIVSPSGKTTTHLPIWTALRVIRKKDWSLATVEPIRPIRRISRWVALGILLTGDNKKVSP